MPRFGTEFLPEERDALIHEARKEPDDAPKMPLGKRVGNFLEAGWRHIEDGMRKVSLDVFKQRLAVCNKCTPENNGWRVKNVCTHTECGCVLTKKCWWASEECPEGKWSTE